MNTSTSVHVLEDDLLNVGLVERLGNSTMVQVGPVTFYFHGDEAPVYSKISGLIEQLRSKTETLLILPGEVGDTTGDRNTGNATETIEQRAKENVRKAGGRLY